MARIVHPEGPTEAKIVIIGEAPGEREEQLGRPFVGPAGQELERELNYAGLARRDCRVTNVFKTRPPNNEIAEFYSETPTPGFVQVDDGAYVRADIAEQWYGTVEELRSYRSANVFVPLGNVALKLTTGLTGITKWAGSVLSGRFGKTIPTVHPAAIIRQWSWRFGAIHDYKRIRAESAFPEVRTPEWRFIIRPSLEHVLSVLESLPERISCDIETRRGAIECFGIGWSALDAICIPFTGWSEDEELELVRALVRALRERRVIGQNFYYDAYYIALQWGALIVPYLDTMVAHHVCWPDLPKSLDFLARIYSPFYAYWKDDVKEVTSAWLQGETLWRYNCLDCVYTYCVAEALESLVKVMNRTEQLENQMRLFEPVMRASLKGLRVDPERRAAIKQQIDQRVATLESELRYILDEPELNLNSPVQKRRIFYEELRMKERFNRKTGNVTVNDDAMRSMVRDEPLLKPVVDRWLKAVHYKVMRSHWLAAEGPPDRLFCGLNQSGTKTFRFSSSTNPFGWGTNLQNLPKERVPGEPDVRSMIVPEPGRVLVELDLRSADLHVVVWECNDDEMRAMLAEGVDFYEQASKALGITRDLGKSFIHGTNYGGKPRTMASVCGITVHEAERLQARWFQMHPSIRRWHQRVERALTTSASVSTAFGYTIRFFDRLESLLPEALAWIPQTTVALVINQIWRNVYYSPLRFVFDPILPVHDSLLFDAAPDWRDHLDELKRAATVVVPYRPRPLIIPFEVAFSEVSWSKMDMQKIKI